MTRGAVLGSIAAAVVITVVIVFAVRGAIERALLQSFLTRTTGASVSIGGIHDALDAFSLERLHVEGGGASLDVPRVDVRIGGPLDITLHEPRAAYAPQPAAANAAVRDPIAATVAWLTDSRARVRVTDGRVDFAAAPPPAGTAHIAAIAGSLALDPADATYDVHADVLDGAQAYPFVARGERRGTVVRHAWSAPALPAAALSALLPAPAVVFESGELRDVSVTLDGTLVADATASAVSAVADGFHLRGLTGPLALRGMHFGSSGISGTLEGVPFSFVGEVRDVGDLPAALIGGTRDLRELNRLFTMIAAQHDLQFVRLETTAPGIAFAQYGAHDAVGPRVISLVAIDPAEPTLKLGTAISSDHVISKGERTSQLAQRTGAVAGVNGDYFDIGRTYEPQGLLVRDGAILRGPANRAALVIDRSNNVTFGEFTLNGSVRTRGKTYPITQLNSWPLGEATVITPDYGTELPPAPGATFVRLEAVDAAKHEYRATAVEAADAPLPVSFGVGFGPAAHDVKPRAGDRFILDYELSPRVPGMMSGIGGGPILLKDGNWYEDPHAPAPDERDVRWPVVALGRAGDGMLLLAAVDGRHPERAVGMTRPEFAALLQSFGMRDAMALDSGGSVTLVSRAPGDRAASVRNKPSDDSAERYISDALLVFSSAPPNDIVKPAPSASPSASAAAR